jgi:hypothetical protein
LGLTELQRSVRVQLERICRIDHDFAFEQFVVLGDECVSVSSQTVNATVSGSAIA